MKLNWDSRQDGGIGKHALPPCTTIAKITTGLQNKYHPDLSEKWAVGKSDKDLKGPHSSKWVGGVAERTAPHSRVVDKNWERYLGSQSSLP